MARLDVDFFSEALEVGASITVLLPQPVSAQVGLTGAAAESADGPPVLYLLHGLSDDHTAWTRYTSVERYAAEHGVAVVMPAVGRSFYANEVHGHAYWDFLADELPSVVGRFLRVSSRREDTFVAGLSMGGYGALKWALRRPERFAAAASLSGALDVAEVRESPDLGGLWRRVFGDGLAPSDDLFSLLDRADPETLPTLYVGCGTQDHLYRSTSRFADALRAKGIDARVELRPGDHEWGYWDEELRRVLAWLPLPGRRSAPRESR